MKINYADKSNLLFLVLVAAIVIGLVIGQKIVAIAGVIGIVVMVAMTIPKMFGRHRRGE